MDLTQTAEIIIADAQFLVVEGLKATLGEKYQISGTVNSKAGLEIAFREKIPDLLIIDYYLMDFDGYNDLGIIKKKYPDLGIIILSNSLSRNEIIEYNNLGIKNILHKSVEKDELFECIRAVLSGKKYYSGSVLDLMFESNGKKEVIDQPVQLTVSEMEILRLIADGLTNKEIAFRKILSIHTIMTHRKNIMRKLGVSNASELIMYAIKKGMIDTIEYNI